jgi:hypothetical protein
MFHPGILPEGHPDKEEGVKITLPPAYLQFQDDQRLDDD